MGCPALISEMNARKYKEIASAMAQAFGVQRKTRAFESPMGIKMAGGDFDQELVPTRERLEFIATQEREEKRIGV